MSANGDVIIRVEHLTAKYGGNLVFDDVSFEIRRGEVFVILGGSGSGKSTMLKHMIGLYAPHSGRVYIDGDEITGSTGEERLRIVRRFGVMYQMGALFGSRTLLENVRLPLEEFTRLPAAAMDAIAATIACTLTGGLRCPIASIAEMTAAEPAMSVFMVSMPLAVLIDSPPESNVTPLPTRPMVLSGFLRAGV